MNSSSSSSKYMDKQITELSKCQARSFLNDDDDGDGDDEEDHGRSFHFRPILPRNNAHAIDGTHLRGWSSMDRIGSTNFSSRTSKSNVALISEIDRKLKEHTDVLLHSVECLSARVSQIESRTRRLENAFDDLKESIEFNHGGTDGKLQELENVLMEVQGGVKYLTDKQDISEAQFRLAKLQLSRDDSQLAKQNTTLKTNMGTEAFSSILQQPHQPLPGPVTSSSSVANIPLLNHPQLKPAAMAPQFPTPPVTSLPNITATAPQIPTQLQHNLNLPVPQQESYYQPPVLASDNTQQQYHVAPTQHSQSLLNQLYQPPPHLPVNLQLPQLSKDNPTMVNPPVHYLSSCHLGEPPLIPSHSTHNMSQPPGRTPPLLQFNVGSSQQIQLQWQQREGQANISEKAFQSFPSPPVSGGESSCSRLPVARILPQAIPTASSVDAGSGSGSGGSGNRVSVDDVVDKVVAMGFRRDMVRATVKKLTENGQSVDLNVVLDKVMNNG